MSDSDVSSDSSVNCIKVEEMKEVIDDLKAIVNEEALKIVDYRKIILDDLFRETDEILAIDFQLNQARQKIINRLKNKPKDITDELVRKYPNVYANEK